MSPPPAKKQKPDTSHYDNPKFSDLIIKFSGEEFHAHRVTVCQKSGYFRNALEKDFSEAHSGVVDLQYHDDPMHVRAMLRHFYGLPYDQMVDSEPSTTKTHRDLVFHAAVFTLADYYDVPCLRIAVVATFERNFKLCVLWNSKDFLDSIESAFKDHEGRADKRLQETIVKLCLEHLEDLVKKDDFLPLLEKVGPLSASLLKETWKNVENRHVMVCIACSKTRDSCCDVGCGQEDFESVQITFMGN